MSTRPRPDLETLFGEALRRPAGLARDAYVRTVCGGDADLRAELEGLLRAHETSEDFLEQPAVAPAGAAGADDARQERPGGRIGPYRLVRELGEGGFGVVWEAEQEQPVRRAVALKVIKLGMDTRQVITRFEAERQALALLDHPNVARVLDAGATDTGRPYFVMELVRGVDIVPFADTHRLSIRERIELFLDVLGAIHHAHQRGLIHRDLKPSNILVAEQDGRPVPKVIDFGIAKATDRRLTEATLQTEVGQFVGTPVYMSPEQADSAGLEVDTRSDVYSLGVVLYELLTGTTPFTLEELRRHGLGEMQSFIRDHEAPTPSLRATQLGDRTKEVARARRTSHSELRHDLRGDLDWVVMRALEKDPARRYESVAAFAKDLERFLGHQPVEAGPPSRVYRLRKFVRRNRVAVLAGSIVLAALLAGTAFATYGFVQARHQAELADGRSDALAAVLLAAGGQGVGDAAALEREVRARFGARHEAVPEVVRYVAVQQERSGQYEAATTTYARAVELLAEIHHPEHQRVAEVRGELGMLFLRRGRVEEARRELRAAREIDVADGRPSPALNAARLAYARIAADSGDLASARTLAQEAVDVAEEQAGGDAALLVEALSTMRDFELAAGAQERIPETWRRLVSALDLVHASGTVPADERIRFGTWLATTHRTEEAKRTLLAGIEAYDEADAPRRRVYLEGLPVLGDLLARGDAAEVERSDGIFERYEELARDLLPPGSRALADAIERHAAHHEARGRHGRAIRAVLAAHQIRASRGVDATHEAILLADLDRLAEALLAKEPPADYAAAALATSELVARRGDQRSLLMHSTAKFFSGDVLGMLRAQEQLSAMTGEEHPGQMATNALYLSLIGAGGSARNLLAQAERIAAEPKWNGLRDIEQTLEIARRIVPRSGRSGTDAEVSD